MATILIAEDYPPNRVALAAVLEANHHRVLQAGNGVEALAQLQVEPCDLVICDILMPSMDGYAFIRELRGNPALANIPVVFWTATFDQPEARLLARGCGVLRILAKPAKAEDVQATVNAALRDQAPGPMPEASFDHAYLRLLLEKLGRKVTELEVERLSPKGRPILVVEDNPMDLDFLLQAFEENNVANPVVVCRDGEEALRFIGTHASPDDPELPLVVLLDLRLPKVNGLEVLRQARQHSVWKQVPFVAITTSRENTDIAAAYELGVNSYIVKPVDFTAFADIVKRIKAYWLLTNEAPFSLPGRKG